MDSKNNFPPIRIGNLEIKPQSDPLHWGEKTPVPQSGPIAPTGSPDAGKDSGWGHGQE